MMAVEESSQRPEGAVCAAVMSDRDFKNLSRFVYDVCGIRMPPAKRLMLEGRLRRRLRILGLDSFEKYWAYLSSSKGLETELVHMVDAITTNKTDFFRESSHFDYLCQVVLPQLTGTEYPSTRRAVNVWSAGCSTGEEPYTLAMVLSEYGEKNPSFRFSILATDISTRVLDKAASAIYDHQRVEPVPIILRKKYLLRGKNKNRELVRIAPELRSLVTFRRLNFMDDDYGISSPMSVIFCRNVLIYFDRPTQERLINRFCDHLIPGGYLFTGHSETLQGLGVPLVHAANTVYRKGESM